jgi:hypothetical protein
VRTEFICVACVALLGASGCFDPESPATDDAGGSGPGGEDAGSPSRCALAFEPGPCEAAFEVYWFNPEQGVCQKQTYGGCEGNDNRFETQAACQDACVAASDTACTTDADCGWGEIGHEIVTPADCICLFGCPYIPLNQDTVDRRLAQHTTLCDPQHDGQGQPCPIDDCASPAPAMCIEGSCTGDPFGGS